MRSLATTPLDQDAVVVIEPYEYDPVSYDLLKGDVPVEYAKRYFNRQGASLGGLEGIRFEPHPLGSEESKKGTVTKEKFIARYLRAGLPEVQRVEISVRLKKPLSRRSR